MLRHKMKKAQRGSLLGCLLAIVLPMMFCGCSGVDLRGPPEPSSTLSDMAYRARQNSPPTEVTSLSRRGQDIERNLGAR